MAGAEGGGESRFWYAPDLAPEELAFQRLYGPWQAFSVPQAREVFDRVGVSWWIAGGHAAEAFSGVHRDHEDIDVSIFRRDLPLLREALDGEMHIWSAGEGTLRPVTDRFPEAAADADQVWLREHALAPWRVDVLLNPDVDGRWQSRRDPTFSAPLDEVTWWHEGIRYLNPEIVLAFKAKLARPKDDRDLDAVLPRLSASQVGWLADYLARIEPGHPWQARL